MNVLWLSDQLGDGGAAVFGGLLIGLLFGACAQRSSFCLRAATVEFWRGQLGPKTAIWLAVFGTALLGTQLLFQFGALDSASVRQLTQVGTLSGAVIGGLVFGAGMVLARGCASRLLVLSATGNLRALVTGLILTMAAQASLRGIFSPIRQDLASIWLVGPEARNLVDLLPAYTGILAGVATLIIALLLARRHQLDKLVLLCSVGVGAAVAFGWWFTSALASQSFDPVSIESISFTGPSTDTLMALINQPDLPLKFGIGLVPGVFLGSLISAVLSGEFRVQSFGPATPMPRYIAGAFLMGFGSMLAGGCAVGAGVTGGAVLALTAWVALASMWLGAGLTDLIIDRKAVYSGSKEGVPSAG